eukprot:11521482-Alexandrium_andersonii.AAC.1
MCAACARNKARPAQRATARNHGKAQHVMHGLQQHDTHRDAAAHARGGNAQRNAARPTQPSEHRNHPRPKRGP